jgi:hypothetical protein
MRYAKQIKKWLILVWLLIPVGLLSYHYGPGRQALAWQEAAAIRAQATAAEKEGHWEQAVTNYGQALGAVPTSEVDDSDEALARDQLRLAQIRSKFQLGDLAETISDLEQFVKQVETTHGLESPVTFDARDMLGRVHYQAMVALRLESAEKQVWMRHWELSRQSFRFLAEHSPPSRNLSDRKNLEVVIKSANLPTPPVPSGGGGGGGAALQASKRPTPPTTGSGVAAPDQRRLTPTNSISELNPPEFKLGN